MSTGFAGVQEESWQRFNLDGASNSKQILEANVPGNTDPKLISGITEMFARIAASTGEEIRYQISPPEEKAQGQLIATCLLSGATREIYLVNDETRTQVDRKCKFVYQSSQREMMVVELEPVALTAESCLAFQLSLESRDRELRRERAKIGDCKKEILGALSRDVPGVVFIDELTSHLAKLFVRLGTLLGTEYPFTFGFALKEEADGGLYLFTIADFGQLTAHNRRFVNQVQGFLSESSKVDPEFKGLEHWVQFRLCSLIRK